MSPSKVRSSPRTSIAATAAKVSERRSSVVHAVEVRPGVEQAETRLECCAADLRLALGAANDGPDDPRRGAALDHVDALERALEEARQPRGHLLGRELAPPAVGRRLVVVGVFDRAQVAVRRAVEDVLDVLGVPARSREEERRRDLVLVGDHFARGLLDRAVGALVLAVGALVDLGARVGIERAPARERVAARRDGLRLERLERPRRRHLGRDHPADVGVGVERVDGLNAAALRAELERAAIAPARNRDRAAVLARDAQRLVDVDQLAVVLPDELHAAVRGRLGDVAPARLQPSARVSGCALEGDAAGAAAEQDAHLLALGAFDLHVRVVVVEDLLVVAAVLREAVGPVLAHPDAMAEAAAADDEARRVRARGCEQQGRDRGEEGPLHAASFAGRHGTPAPAR